MFDTLAFSTPPHIALAIVTAICVGLSKGGLGGTLAILGVAMLAFIMPPVQAAAIMLPILLVMDFVACWIWRGTWDRAMVRMMLPAAIAGVAFGWATAAYVSDDLVRLIIGGIALGYLAFYLHGLRGTPPPPRAANPMKASFWGFWAGYGSFVAHAGGPAYQVYAMPLRAAPVVFTGTSTLFFTIVNIVKTLPYAALGQFDATNLASSLVLMPFAAVSTFAGAFIVKRLPMGVFYGVLHVMLALIAAKLLWDGFTGVLA